jgi:hypothetical protein
MKRSRDSTPRQLGAEVYKRAQIQRIPNPESLEALQATGVPRQSSPDNLTEIVRDAEGVVREAI